VSKTEQDAPTHRSPEGSTFEAGSEQRRARTLKRRIRHGLSRALVGLAVGTLPYLYYAYCWFVWKTSRVVDNLTDPLTDAYARHDRFVALLWHQEVFTVAYAYRHLHGTTLASTGNFGRLITRMLELCNFQVFRGGSSRGRVRKRRVLLDMIRHMQSNERVGYGITVDGSHGPALRMKKGGPVIGKTCRAPLFVVRTWCSSKLLLPSWDRTAIPLPFGRIELDAVGPYWIDPEGSEEDMEQACRHLEHELLELAEHCYRRFEGSDSEPRWREGFPEGWEPRWSPDRLGTPLGPHDLRPDDPPAYANQPVASSEAA
jgi:lysophospholipid acyltransferase (LPLAT)-like uncharacterized protein